MELIIAAISVAIAFGLGYLAAQLRHRYGDLIRRIEKLEQESPKRHTHRTCAGIEDATAIAIDLIANLQAEQARLDSLMSVLHTLRVGPRAYNPERPAGKRLNDM